MKNENTKKLLLLVSGFIGSLVIACLLSIIPTFTIPVATKYDISFNFYENRNFYFISLLLIFIISMLYKQKQSGFSAITVGIAGVCSVLISTVYYTATKFLFDVVYTALQPRFFQPEATFTIFYCLLAVIIACVWLMGEVLIFKLSIVIAKIKPISFLKPTKYFVVFMLIALAIKALITCFYALTALPATADSFSVFQMPVLYLNQIFDVAVLVFITVKAFKIKKTETA